jgi:hypothetical protein
VPDAPEGGAGNVLTRKIGPLPVWGWVGAVALGLGYGYYRRTHPKAAGAPDLISTTPDNGFGTTVPGVGAGAVGTAPSTTPATPTDNQSWSVLAQSRLIALGYNPGAVSDALGLWLSGSVLTAQQAAIRDEAIRVAGPPPEPVPPAVTQTPAPGPILPGGGTGTVPSDHTYVVQFHRVGAVGTTVDARAYITALATDKRANDIETALQATVNDARNSKYKATYAHSGGKWPGGAALYVTIPMLKG